ncbi:hypothetical protein ALCH109712_01175 [Alkalicoccus chagannorensis]
MKFYSIMKKQMDLQEEDRLNRQRMRDGYEHSSMLPVRGVSMNEWGAPLSFVYIFDLCGFDRHVRFYL